MRFPELLATTAHEPEPINRTTPAEILHTVAELASTEICTASPTDETAAGVYLRHSFVVKKEKTKQKELTLLRSPQPQWAPHW